MPDAYGSAPVGHVAGDSVLAAATAAALERRGWTVHRGDLDGTSSEMSHAVDLVLVFPEVPGGPLPGALAEAEVVLRDVLLLASRAQSALERGGRTSRAAFVTVTETDGSFGIRGAAGPARACLGGVTGLVKTLALEAPALVVRSVDLAPDLGTERAVEELLDELHDADTSVRQVGRSVEGRWTLGLGDAPDPQSPGTAARSLGSDDVVLVTGGARGVTAACAIGLARATGCGLVLLGRTAPEEEPSWAHEVPDDGLRAAAAVAWRAQGRKATPRALEPVVRALLAGREVRRTLADIRAAGSEVEYVTADVTDAEAVRAALRPHAARITGLVHGAGTLADGPLATKSAASVDSVLRPKLRGLGNVLGALHDELAHIVLFSSVAGFFGNPGQADYAMANEALLGLAGALRRGRPSERVTAIAWGAWAGGMVTPALERMFAARGVPLIPVPVGVDFLVEQFTATRGRDVVCVVGPSAPLAEAPGPLPLPVGTQVIRRLQGVAADPVFDAHRIASRPVIPLAAAVGLVLAVAGLTRPSTPVRRIRGVAVTAGVVLDADGPRALHVTLGQGGPGDDVGATVRDERGRCRYTVRALDGGGGTPEALLPMDVDSGAEFDPYAEGVLFHGPALRASWRLLVDADRLVVAVTARDAVLAGGSWATADFSPVLADVLLQAVLVWAARRHRVAVLPVAVGAVDLVRPLRSSAPMSVTVEPVARVGQRFRVSVTACSPDGEVLLRMSDVDAVARPGPPAGTDASCPAAAAQATTSTGSLG